MQSVILTWTENSGHLVIFDNRIIVRSTKDGSSTAIFIDGVMHTVTEPLEQVVNALNGMRGF